jgi:hypothetical protein
VVHVERAPGGEVAFEVYRPSPPPVPRSIGVRFEGGLALRHWEAAEVADGVLVRTWWEVEGDELPVVKQFLHLVQEGAKAAGNDRFDAYAPSLRAGDLVVQQTLIATPAGDYEMVIGLYDPETLQRWTLADGDEDHLYLGPIAIGAPSGG